MVVATCVALVVVLTALAGLLRTQSALRTLVADLGDRVPQIDGLRGICALLVAAHHSVYCLGFTATGIWDIAASDHILNTMGKSAVAYFFMICAYLFWGREAGNASSSYLLDFKTLMRNRAARLVPAYLVAMVVAMIVCGLGTQHFHLMQDYWTTLAQVVSSLTFSFFGSPLFNGSFLAYAAISVSWSLRLEWLFYCALIPIRFLRLRRIWPIALPLVIVVNVAVTHIPWIEYFAYGALMFELARWPAVSRRLAGIAGDAASLALFVGANFIFATEDTMSGLAPAVFALSFLPIAAGASWCGLLRTDAARLLGATSYSLYLLNIPAIVGVAALMSPASGGVTTAASTEALDLGAAILLSLLSFRYVEMPFMRRRAVGFREGVSLTTREISSGAAVLASRSVRPA